ncbi:MAG: signal recognition particle-docking protein FtsY [Kiritimatiellae bacterium]|nr:signal recognition particle-docking protein FtsY [Kiritimatiellia bacterium]
MASWWSALRKTRDALAGALDRITGVRRPDAASLADLEEALIRADVPARVAADAVQQIAHTDVSKDPARQQLARLLKTRCAVPQTDWLEGEAPRTVLVVGVNGSGKTTTCAKLARIAAARGARPLLCAGDTFRAAGVTQMRLWAERLGIDVVGGNTGSDAAAVAYDALDAAIARGSGCLIVDTAGRMHTRQPLMQELEKMRRAMSKRLPRAPDETWIVLDAALGRNAIAQARQFHAGAPLTGAIVSKLDGSSKGGFVFEIAEDLGVPIRYVGLGEGPDDLAPFDPDAFVQSLLNGAETHAAG